MNNALNRLAGDLRIGRPGPGLGRWMRGVAAPAAAVCLALQLAGCAMLPASGPTSESVISVGSTELPPYALVYLSPQILSLVGRHRPRSGGMGNLGPSPEVLLGVGDVVRVTIFEAAAGGLFIPSNGTSLAGNFVELPQQTVDNAGNIAVPYVGAVRAANRSVPAIQQEIVERLPDRAIDPQVVISIEEQRSTQVSVLGTVNAPSRFAINPAGERLLDAIARAGGPAFPGYETYVTLQRGQREGTQRFNELVANPGDNIFVQPGDTVVVSRRPESFVALGASGQNAQINFDADTITLAEALGKAGGLRDERANPTYLFVYRLETRATVERLGQGRPEYAGAELVPTIYAIDLRDPSGYFLAANFVMSDKDVVYIANAPVTDLSKIFVFVRSAAQTASASAAL